MKGLTIAVLAIVGFFLAWIIIVWPAEMPRSTNHALTAATPPAAPPLASKRYFQYMLISARRGESGNPFEQDVAALGLDLRQLQAMPIGEAYTIAHKEAMRVAPIALRRQILLELFNETED